MATRRIEALEEKVETEIELLRSSVLTLVERLGSVQQQVSTPETMLSKNMEASAREFGEALLTKSIVATSNPRMEAKGTVVGVEPARGGDIVGTIDGAMSSQERKAANSVVGSGRECYGVEQVDQRQGYGSN